MKVPFMDLAKQQEPMRNAILQAMASVVDSGEFCGGREVEAFEREFAHYCGVAEAVGVGSGTDALWLALAACGIGPGDEVITVSLSFFATAEAISFTGATPVFVDIDEATYTMAPGALEAALTERTKAIVPVHLFGQMADMDPILAFAARHGLRVIEDAAQAHGATYKGRKAGSMGDAGCFSFYPSKNLGGVGESGAVTTNDELLACRVRALANHGQTRKNHHELIGFNGRMDAIQAAVLRIKLRGLDEENRARGEQAAFYARSLAGLDEVVLPQVGVERAHAWHIHAIQIAERDEVASSLARTGVGHGIHYPVPIHLQPAYHHLGYHAGDLPVSERCARRFLSLPVSSGLRTEQLEKVRDAIMAAIPVTAGI